MPAESALEPATGRIGCPVAALFETQGQQRLRLPQAGAGAIYFIIIVHNGFINTIVLASAQLEKLWIVEASAGVSRNTDVEFRDSRALIRNRVARQDERASKSGAVCGQGGTKMLQSETIGANPADE